MKICHKCYGNYEKHGIFRIKLDTIIFDSDSYLRNRLKSNFGICDVRLDYFDGHLIIIFNPRIICEKQIIQLLNTPGFLLKENFIRNAEQFFSYHGNVIRLAACGLLVVISWMMRVRFEEIYNLPLPGATNLLTVRIAYAATNLLAIAIAIAPYFRKLFATFKRGLFSVNVLMFIAITGALLTGYWLEAATFSLVAVFVEAFEKIISVQTWHEYLNGTIANAKNAYVIEGDSSRKIPIHELKVGQLVSVKRGMLIPTDGTIVSGSGFIDEASITGESIIPVKKRGDKVYAGTLLENGSITVEATNIGHDTTIAAISKMINDAQHEKETKIKKTADSCAAWLTCFILAYSAFLFIASYWVIHNSLASSLVYCLSIIFVACPCTLLLSTPLAIHAGVGLAARFGIIFRNGHILEEFAKTKTLLLDKTGTLTHGNPEVREARAFSACSTSKMLRIAAALEQNSYHPLALAVCAYVISRGLKISVAENYQKFEGGISASLNGKTYYLGAKKLMRDLGVEFTQKTTDWLEMSSARGYEVILIADEQKIIGGFSFVDRLREEAVEAIAKIRSLGMERMIMVTGDNNACAERISKQLGLDEYHAECFPETKLKCIRTLKSQERVAMIGDGINDAPALTAATVGIVMVGVGTDAAVAAADIVLGSGGLNDLAIAYDLSKKVYLTIKFNIALSVLLMIIMVALVSTGQISLTVSTFLYIGSSLLVIMSSYVSFLLTVPWRRRKRNPKIKLDQ